AEPTPSRPETLGPWQPSDRVAHGAGGHRKPNLGEFGAGLHQRAHEARASLRERRGRRSGGPRALAPSGARALSAGFRGRLALLARSHGIGAPGGRLVRRPGGADDLRSTLVVLLPRSALAASPLGTGPWQCAEYLRWLLGPPAHPTLMIPHAPIAG